MRLLLALAIALAAAPAAHAQSTTPSHLRGAAAKLPMGVTLDEVTRALGRAPDFQASLLCVASRTPACEESAGHPTMTRAGWSAPDRSGAVVLWVTLCAPAGAGPARVAKIETVDVPVASRQADYDAGWHRDHRIESSAYATCFARGQP